jgi:hypothetical protein
MSNSTFGYKSSQQERQSEEQREKAKYENTVFLFFIIVCLGIGLVFWKLI